MSAPELTIGDGTTITAQRPRRRAAWPATLVIGLIGLGVWVIVSYIGPIVVTGDPLKIDMAQTLRPPGAEYWFGTDNFGRDIFVRVIHGSQIVLQVGLIATIPPLLIGSILGLAAGYFGKWVETIVMWLVDVLTAFPFLILVIAIVSILGPGLENMILAIATVGWVSYARLVRSEVLVVRGLDYVSAARTLGFNRWRILGRHVLPNVLVQPLLLSSSSFVGYIMLASSLGYLGLGARPPAPEWGAMIATGRDFLVQAPWISVFPGLAIAVVSGFVLLIGDGLSDRFRPELEQ